MPRGMKTTSPGQIVRKTSCGCGGFKFRHRRLHSKTLPRADCPPGRSITTIVLWCSQADRCSTPSARTPLIDSAELARILGEAHATVHRTLTGLLAEGIVGRVSSWPSRQCVTVPSSAMWRVNACHPFLSWRRRRHCGPSGGCADA